MWTFVHISVAHRGVPVNLSRPVTYQSAYLPLALDLIASPVLAVSIEEIYYVE